MVSRVRFPDAEPNIDNLRIISMSSENVKKWRSFTKDRMVAAMGGKCQCCGYNKTNRALSFHHIDPNKKDLGISEIRANPKSWTLIVNELKKCILVCHNCHMEIHEGIQTIPDNYCKFDLDFESFTKISDYNNCPACQSSKPESQKYCSKKCAQTNRRKVDWNSIDLIKLMEEHSISELEKILGVSNAAIYKRRDKILKEKL